MKNIVQIGVTLLRGSRLILKDISEGVKVSGAGLERRANKEEIHERNRVRDLSADRMVLTNTVGLS